MRPTFQFAACAARASDRPAAAGSFAATAPAAKPTTQAWTVDKANSRIRFRSAFSGTAFEGGFGKWDAQINFDPKNLAGSKVVVTVDLASAVSGDADRDSTLPTADWFDIGKTPRASFTSTSIKDLGGGKYQAAGTLSLKGVSKAIVLPFTLAIPGDTAKMSGQVVLNRRDYKVGEGQFTGADTVPFDVTVPVTVTAKKG